MTAEAIAKEILPAVITLDDLAAMNHVDTHGRRYEISPEGVLSVVPPPPRRPRRHRYATDALAVR